MQKKYLALMALIHQVLNISTPASAREKDVIYGSISGGVSDVMDFPSTLNGHVFREPATSGNGSSGNNPVLQPNAATLVDTRRTWAVTGHFQSKTGFMLQGDAGYDFGLLRLDAEASYTESTLTSITLKSAQSGTFSTDFNGINPLDAQDICKFLDTLNCSINSQTPDNRLRFDDYKLRHLQVMLNGWMDLPTGSRIEPYVGGGLGIVALKMNHRYANGFAWQVGSGVAVHLTDAIALTGDIRYRTTGKISMGMEDNGTLRVRRMRLWSYGLGLRYSL